MSVSANYPTNGTSLSGKSIPITVSSSPIAAGTNNVIANPGNSGLFTVSSGGNSNVLTVANGSGTTAEGSGVRTATMTYTNGAVNQSGAVLAPGQTSATGTAYIVSAEPVSMGYTVGLNVVASGYSTSTNNGTFTINAINSTPGGYYVQVATNGQTNQTSGTFGTITEVCAGGAFNANGPKLPGSSTSIGS
jgi:hypothetical protein